MKTITKSYKITGLDCTSCAVQLESELEDAGIKAKCDIADELLNIQNYNKSDDQKIQKITHQLGYKLT